MAPYTFFCKKHDQHDCRDPFGFNVNFGEGLGVKPYPPNATH